MVNKTKEILRIAVNCFGQKGIENTSIQHIADLCGVAQTTIIYQFKTKTKLLAACIDFTWRSNDEFTTSLLSSKDNARELITGHFNGNLKWCDKKPNDARFLLLIYYMASHNPEIKKFNQEILRTSIGKIEAILYAGIREKLFDIKNSEVSIISELLYENLMGALINYVSAHGGKANKSKIEKKWQYLFKQLLYATKA